MVDGLDRSVTKTQQMRLLVVSHTPHYQSPEGVVGWGPTVRELDHLATLFSSLTHIAPLYSEAAHAAATPYTNDSISLVPVAPSGGSGMAAKLGILVHWFHYGRAISRELRRCDAVHVRCPANIALLAILQLKFRKNPKFRWFKYAGNWGAARNQPLAYRLQRWLLQRQPPGTLVTVNGQWPDQPPHILAFENPTLTADEIHSGDKTAQGKSLEPPVRLLFVSRLEPGKGLHLVIDSLRILVSGGVEASLDVIGDGSLRQHATTTLESALRPWVRFLGWIPRSSLAQHLDSGHFLILPSESEGWPKVLSEAMAHGVVPISSAVSSIPAVLSESGAGVAIEDPTAELIADCIRGFLDRPETWTAARDASLGLSPKFSYDHYLAAVARAFSVHWLGSTQ